MSDGETMTPMCAVCEDCPATCKHDGILPLYLCDECSRGNEDHGCEAPSANLKASESK